jgi:hypothetical protein
MAFALPIAGTTPRLHVLRAGIRRLFFRRSVLNETRPVHHVIPASIAATTVGEIGRPASTVLTALPPSRTNLEL